MHERMIQFIARLSVGLMRVSLYPLCIAESNIWRYRRTYLQWNVFTDRVIHLNSVQKDELITTRRITLIIYVDFPSDVRCQLIALEIVSLFFHSAHA